MSKKYYVVWKGIKPGIYDSWPAAKSQTDGRADAQFMGFPSKPEAEAAYQSTYTKALMSRSLNKSPSANSYSSKPSKTSQITGTANSRLHGNKAADVNIYCDGACSPNPGKSGTGIAIYEDINKKSQLTSLWYGLYQANGTNNTAELNGLLKSLEVAQKYIAQNKKVQVLSDSKYSIDCVTKWAKGWQAKGWTRGKGEEIKNLELIKQCFALYQQLKNELTITHVKGHANIEGNELSDRMAVLARLERTSDFVQFTKTLDIDTVLAMTDDS
ncbi:MAG: ribonuclease H family protein [Colwellia sp.]|nr:ribonuclease H family protein [Colwellia sp.]